MAENSANDNGDIQGTCKEMIAKLLEKHLSGIEAANLLDVGSGVGRYGVHSAKIVNAKSATCVDVSEEALSIQADYYSEAGVRFNKVVMDIEHWDQSSFCEKYDVVLCIEVLEHLHDPSSILKKIFPLMKDGGTIIITTPAGVSEKIYKVLNPAYMRDVPYGHVQMFTLKELVSIVKKCGFQVQESFPNQPHYFFSQAWLCLSRVNINGQLGEVQDRSWKLYISTVINAVCLKIFTIGGNLTYRFFSHCFPRNYFICAVKPERRWFEKDYIYECNILCAL